MLNSLCANDRGGLCLDWTLTVATCLNPTRNAPRPAARNVLRAETSLLPALL